WAFGAVLPVALFLACLVQTQIAARPPASESRAPVRIPMAQIALLVVSVLIVSVASLSEHVGWSLLGIGAALLVGASVARLDARGATRLMPEGAYELSRLG